AELQDDVGTLGFVIFSDKEVLEVNDEILNLEASKTVMAILTPIAGRVVERNTAALEQPTLLNSEKPEENWLIRLT
ncbi:glycine cleavage system protein H, partial [Streptococcus suis]